MLVNAYLTLCNRHHECIVVPCLFYSFRAARNTSGEFMTRLFPSIL